MPTNHRTSFTKKCSDDPSARQRTPGCSVRDSDNDNVKKFEPHPRTAIHQSKEKVTLNELNYVNDKDTPTLIAQSEPENDIDTENETQNENINDNQNVSDPQNTTYSLSHVKFNYIDEDTRKLPDIHQWDTVAGQPTKANSGAP